MSPLSSIPLLNVRPAAKRARLDFAVNNDGLVLPGRIDQKNIETWDEVMVVTVRGTHLM
ncbi:MAG: hypothetical protein Q6373_015945 [Candidatus Sigynarchaeota archaeon]